MERIVFLDSSSVQAKFKSPGFPHEWLEYSLTHPDEIISRLNNATIAITNKVPLRRDTIEQLPKLKFIAVAATGTDCVDVQYCRANGIVVSNVSGYAIHSVPEHVFGLILALRRSLMPYQMDIQAGKWQASQLFCMLDHPIVDLHRSTIGIIGYGALGQAVEKIALAFGMRVLISERKSTGVVRSGRVSFAEVLSESDILTLHCPLNIETRGLIGTDELKRMKAGALLINCGRGGLVDEVALAEALENRDIAGAGVDVLSQEPPTAGNPLLDKPLPNLLITPHVAWASADAMQRLADILIDNLEAFVAGRPRNIA